VVYREGKWLVGEEERNKRIEQDYMLAMVLVKVIDRERVGELCQARPWVGSVWCSVRKFVAVLVRRKEAGWVRVKDRLDERIGMVE